MMCHLFIEEALGTLCGESEVRLLTAQENLQPKSFCPDCLEEAAEIEPDGPFGEFQERQEEHINV